MYIYLCFSHLCASHNASKYNKIKANSSFSFSEDTPWSSMVALDAETGDITLTSDLSDLTEDMLLNLTAKATDHGTPTKSATGFIFLQIGLFLANTFSVIGLAEICTLQVAEPVWQTLITVASAIKKKCGKYSSLFFHF